MELEIRVNQKKCNNNSEFHTSSSLKIVGIRRESSRFCIVFAFPVSLYETAVGVGEYKAIKFLQTLTTGALMWYCLKEPVVTNSLISPPRVSGMNS